MISVTTSNVQRLNLLAHNSRRNAASNNEATRLRPSGEGPVRPTKDGYIEKLKPITCSLCLEAYSDDHVPVELPDCRHVFGDHCIVRWFETHSENNNKCPLCRDELFEQEDDDPLEYVEYDEETDLEEEMDETGIKYNEEPEPEPEPELEQGMDDEQFERGLRIKYPRLSDYDISRIMEMRHYPGRNGNDANMQHGHSEPDTEVEHERGDSDHTEVEQSEQEYQRPVEADSDEGSVATEQGAGSDERSEDQENETGNHPGHPQERQNRRAHINSVSQSGISDRHIDHQSSFNGDKASNERNSNAAGTAARRHSHEESSAESMDVGSPSAEESIQEGSGAEEPSEDGIFGEEFDSESGEDSLSEYEPSDESDIDSD